MRTKSKTVELTDPVYPKKDKKQHAVIVHLDSQGFPSGYSMKLVNKVCLEQCLLSSWLSPCIGMRWDFINVWNVRRVSL